MVTDKHLNSILQLFVLVIRQWSKYHTYLTLANGHPKDHKDYRVSKNLFLDQLQAKVNADTFQVRAKVTQPLTATLQVAIEIQTPRLQESLLLRHRRTMRLQRCHCQDRRVINNNSNSNNNIDNNK